MLFAKKVISVFLAAMMVVMGCSLHISAIAGGDVDIDVGEATVLTVSQMNGKYKTQGRTSVQDGLLMLDYSASGFEFEATCAGDVAVTFSASELISGDEGGCYFTVIVDGVAKARDFCRITAKGDTEVTIATGLAAGKHSFQIYRQTEIERATVGIKSVRFSGRLENAPANKDLYIEFVGDSITTAYGNLMQNGASGTASYPLYQDATQGYAYLTAQKLNADFSLVARQGIGASVGFQPVSMNVVYPLLRHAKDTTTPYDFARQPDVVVIALGGNDMSRYEANGKTQEDVKTGFANLLTLVRQKNPNAKIVWAYGMTPSNARAKDLINAVIAEAGGASEGYYSVQLTTNNQGGNGHPYYTAHETMAQELSDFISKTVLAPSSFLPGDIDNDEIVGLKDVVALAQVKAGWDIEYVEAALDPNGDGEFDLDDVVYLAQHVAEWENRELSTVPYVPAA